ncbi:BTAD domain-containing putative transcriptional regulator [Streptomyces winkii]|uniref:BTAD domain-containing putative transcriptional regulator n=1 Tax=Streptomyces winkii TaxID=3051178 RepID=UPI0028D1BEB6|nr:BTAD domain-containing putative transcriptional regulator [Streptomyces sp. DSM 40971]
MDACDLSVGPVLTAQIIYLTEVRIRASELRIEAEKRMGRHRELLPELRSLVREYPPDSVDFARSRQRARARHAVGARGRLPPGRCRFAACGPDSPHPTAGSLRSGVLRALALGLDGRDRDRVDDVGDERAP